jgi:hypothetical protein
MADEWRIQGSFSCGMSKWQHRDREQKSSRRIYRSEYSETSNAFPQAGRKTQMALALLCMMMFIGLTAATLHALHQETRAPSSKIVNRGKWLR